jgi:hypothetical protein
LLSVVALFSEAGMIFAAIEWVSRPSCRLSEPAFDTVDTSSSFVEGRITDTVFVMYSFCFLLPIIAVCGLFRVVSGWDNSAANAAALRGNVVADRGFAVLGLTRFPPWNTLRRLGL